DRAPVEAYAPPEVDQWPAAQYTGSVQEVLDAFGDPTLLGRDVFMAEIRRGIDLPGRSVVGFHLVDYVAHGWDVARTLGVHPSYDDEALTLALEIAEAIPEFSRSDDPRAPFRPSVETSSTALLDRFLANLGRSPDWARPDQT